MREAKIDNLKLEKDDSLSLRDVVFHTLRDAILDGSLPPGTRLMELQLSDVLGVSRTPVREAIHLLDLEGLVTTSVRRGTVVAPISASDLRDALEVRDALEELAVRKAIRNMDDQVLEGLRGFEREFRKRLETGDIKGAAGTDSAFHDRITETAHNRRLSQQLKQIGNVIYRYRLETLKDRSTYPKVLDEHEKLIEAFEKKDEEEAVRVVRIHITDQERMILERIRQQD